MTDSLYQVGGLTTGKVAHSPIVSYILLAIGHDKVAAQESGIRSLTSVRNAKQPYARGVYGYRHAIHDKQGLCLYLRLPYLDGSHSKDSVAGMTHRKGAGCADAALYLQFLKLGFLAHHEPIHLQHTLAAYLTQRETASCHRGGIARTLHVRGYQTIHASRTTAVYLVYLSCPKRSTIKGGITHCIDAISSASHRKSCRKSDECHGHIPLLLG